MPPAVPSDAFPAPPGRPPASRRIPGIVGIYAIMAAVIMAGGFVAVRGLQSATDDMEAVITGHAEELILAEKLRAVRERKGRMSRIYLLTRNSRFHDEMHGARAEFLSRLAELRVRLSTPDDLRHLDLIGRMDEEHQTVLDRVIARRQEGLGAEEAGLLIEKEVQPFRERLDWSLGALSEHLESRLKEAQRDARKTATRSLAILVGVAGVSIFMAAAFAFLLARTFRLLLHSRRELEEQVAKIEGVNRELDAFAGRIAHDFKNMLSPLRLATDSLRDPARTPQDIDRIAAVYGRALTRANGLLDSLLAFSRAGGPPDPLAVSSVVQVVNEAKDSLATAALVADAKVALKLEDIKVVCAPSLLHAVISNLLGNALKFLKGRERREVTITARAVGPSCELGVEDTGPGIPPDALPKIFEPFYRAPGAGPVGTGIGLAIVQRIVQAHGGDVTVESAVGRGSRFKVILPLAAEAAKT